MAPPKMDKRLACQTCKHYNAWHLAGHPCTSCDCQQYNPPAMQNWVAVPLEKRDLNGEFALVDGIDLTGLDVEPEREQWHAFFVVAMFKCYGLDRHVDSMVKVITSEMKLQFGSSFVSLDVGEPEPVEGYVWCHYHCEVHVEKENIYDTSGEEECNSKNWQKLVLGGPHGAD